MKVLVQGWIEVDDAAEARSLNEDIGDALFRNKHHITIQMPDGSTEVVEEL